MKEADEKFFTYIYLINSDKSKYGSIITNLNSQKSLKNDQFPKTMVNGNNVLSNRHYNSTSNSDKNKGNKSNKSKIK